jgi:hypothetical protein
MLRCGVIAWCAVALLLPVRGDDLGSTEVRLSVTVDESLPPREFVVPAGEEPEGAALLFCSETLGAAAATDKQALANCVAELSRHATVERVQIALPVGSPLPPLTLQVALDDAGATADFVHAAGADIAAEATAFCAELVSEDAETKIVADCATRLVANARQRIIEFTVDEEAVERRKAVDDAIFRSEY